MGDDGERDGEAHAVADLEGGADGDAVHGAVADHRGGRGEAHLRCPAVVLVGAVRRLTGRQQAFHQMGHEEAGHEQQQGGRHAVHLGARRLKCLRQQVQADHAQHQAAGQAQHEMAAVGHALCRPAAGQRHQERAERDEDRHVPLLSDQHRVAHVRPGPR